MTNTITRRGVLAIVACAALARGGSAGGVTATDPLAMSVTDARSRRRLMLRDMMQDRTVVINFMFLGCGSACPMQSAVLAAAQRRLGARMGNEVRFLSITMNPLADTPSKLVEFGDLVGAGRGWHFLAGDFAQTQRLRSALGLGSAGIEAHPPAFLIGRAGRADWRRLNDGANPGHLIAAIDALRG